MIDISNALKTPKMFKRYVTFNKVYGIDMLMPLFKNYNGHSDKETAEIDGLTVTIQSQRYDLFKKEYSETGSCKCVSCGIAANCFLMQKSTKESAETAWHFNLYNIQDDGRWSLFTKDHIIPKSRGGKNVPENYQLMCHDCNVRKGQELPEGIPEHEYPVIDGKVDHSKKQSKQLPPEVQARKSMLENGITSEMIDSVVPGSTWIRFTDRQTFLLTVHKNDGLRLTVNENGSLVKPLTQEWKISTFCREMKFGKIVKTENMDIGKVNERIDEKIKKIQEEIYKLENFKKELSSLV